MNEKPNALPLADRRIPAGGDWLNKDEVAKLTPALLAERMRAIAPLAERNAFEAERLCRPVDEVWNEIRRAGYFYQFVPRRFGGMEIDTDGFLDATLPIAEVCASTAWAASFCAEHNWIFAHFREQALKEIWSEFPYIVAPYVGIPPGHAERVEGGYRISGHWKWGTGVMHADWIMVGVQTSEQDNPERFMTLFPASEAKVLDTWHADGMCATGSNDIVAENVFVPKHRTIPLIPMISGKGPGSALFDNPLYSAPMYPFLGFTASMSALGVARGAVAQARKRLTEHVKVGNLTTQVEKPAAQMRLARASLLTEIAEQTIRQAGRDTVAASTIAEPEQTTVRIHLRARIAEAVKMCREAVWILAESSGSSIHMLSHPLQRALRDINSISSHIVFDVDTAYELHGRSLVGLPPNSLLT